MLVLVAAVALAVNEYELIATDKACGNMGRISLPCGDCGPNWGELADCEDVCNTFANCTHVTYFEDKGCRIYSSCNLTTVEIAPQNARAGTQVYERKNPKVISRPKGTCDLLAAAGSPCMAAHSVVRALYEKYTGPLYRLLRDSDLAGLDIAPSPTGFAKVSDQDAFCTPDVTCYIYRIYDQSPMGNHLDTAPAGGACRFPLSPVNAGKDPITMGGRSVYGAYFEGKMGYRQDRTKGIATGETPQTMYMVTRGDHYNGGCCFDYGNAETDNDDEGKGTMEAIYFGNSTGWAKGQGDGPWVMADLENGLWAGDKKISTAPSIGYKFVTAMTKGKKGGFALKAGNAQRGALQTLYEGGRPGGYETMNKQGAIILGIGGDNSCWAVGTFYEGAMTATYTDDATDAAIHANIVSAGYGT